WLEMSSVDRPVTRAVYLAVLSASDPSPLLPETGDEPARAEPQSGGGARPPAAQPPGAAVVRFDAVGIDQRILALPVAAADYASLMPGTPGTVFYTETPRAGGAAPLILH